MLYLDYSREADDWLPNRHGGRENLEAIEFLKELNTTTQTNVPGAIVIAEESTSWPQVSRPADGGGLGFSMKWNMGWMHDSLKYMDLNPIHRKHHHSELTFGLLYAFTENFVLPFRVRSSCFRGLSSDNAVSGISEQRSTGIWRTLPHIEA